MFEFFDLDKRIRKRWQTLAPQCRQCLIDQQIAPGNPGTILRDVDAMLEFIGPDGHVTRSRNANLPADRLAELNQRSSYPIELPLKRPLLRDYPNLSGIFILLRVMDLLQMQGNRLMVRPAALDFWRGLNSTEQYFALFEALLFQAQSSVLGGERRRAQAESFETVAEFLGALSDHWRNFSFGESAHTFGPLGKLPPWNLFVQQQLGLIEIRPRPWLEKERKFLAGRGWLVGGAKLTPWGTAAMGALLEFLKPHLDEEEESELELEPKFGILKPAFQPYFPEWRTVYAPPKREVKSGIHIFKVTLAGWRKGDGGIWRRLAVPPDTSLDILAGTILGAFNLDDDHLFDFRYRDRFGKTRVYYHPETDDGPFTTEITVGETGLAIKDKMDFTFDYGDDWQFEVRLEKIETKPSRLKHPETVESAGQAPEQYPDCE